MEKLKSNLAVKVLALIVITAAIFTVALGIVGIIAMFDCDIYSIPQSQMLKNTFDQVSWGYAEDVAEDFTYNRLDESSYRDYNFRFTAVDESENTVSNVSDASTYTYSYSGLFSIYENDKYKDINVTIYVGDIEADDNYKLASVFVNTAYSLRYAVYFIIAVALITAVLLFVYLMSAAGHSHDSNGVAAIHVLDKIPLDLSLSLLIGFIVLSVGLADMLIDSLRWSIYGIIVFAAAFLLIIPAFVCFCMTFAVRVKVGGWWKNTLICHILRIIWRIIKAIGRIFAAMWRGIVNFVKNTATAPLLITILAIATFIEFIMLIGFADSGDGGMVMFCWFMGKLIFTPVFCYCLFTFKKLKKYAADISVGNSPAPINTKYVFADFRSFADSLTNIGDGINVALERRMQSEMMKTELITNVSHDIKTPITSIINYADLLSREETDNQKIKEYTEVISRQSARLKKLTDDLVEASKASSGNIEVNFAPCEVGTLLDQTLAEYQSRLAGAELTAILNKPDTDAKITADGQLLWRVFDNLMSNICKYSMPQSRVYIDLRIIGTRVVVSFRNVSKYQLNIAPDELTERFVRGDESRAGDGSGLGLSIAKSLTELQNGVFNIQIDGDLFKVMVSFPMRP